MAIMTVWLFCLSGQTSTSTLLGRVSHELCDDCWVHDQVGGTCVYWNWMERREQKPRPLSQNKINGHRASSGTINLDSAVCSTSSRSLSIWHPHLSVPRHCSGKSQSGLVDKQPHAQRQSQYEARGRKKGRESIRCVICRFESTGNKAS